MIFRIWLKILLIIISIISFCILRVIQFLPFIIIAFLLSILDFFFIWKTTIIREFNFHFLIYIRVWIFLLFLYYHTFILDIFFLFIFFFSFPLLELKICQIQFYLGQAINVCYLLYEWALNHLPMATIGLQFLPAILEPLAIHNLSHWHSVLSFKLEHLCH